MRIASAVLLAVGSAVVFGAAMTGMWTCLDGFAAQSWTVGAVTGTVFGLAMGVFSVREQRMLRRVVTIGASRDAFLSRRSSAPSASYKRWWNGSLTSTFQRRTPTGRDPMAEKILSLADLSRATLARQMLLAREKVDPVAAVERVAGMQSQVALAPNVGLFSRVAGLRPGDYERALDERRLVRATLMRGTLHVVSARDYVGLRGTIQLALDHGLRAILKERMKDVAPADVVAKARAFFATPRTMDELRDSGVFEGDVRAQAYAARLLVPLVQLEGARFVLAEKHLKKKIATKADAAELVRRYLAAYGPATIADAQTWSGVPDLKDAFAAIRDELVSFDKLFDLSRAPRPGADTPAPPRLLPEFDSIVLAHKDRRRFVADAHRKAVYLPGLRVAKTVLVGGVVAGTWTIDRAKLTIRTFDKLARTDKDALAAEAEALLAFDQPRNAPSARTTSASVAFGTM